MKAGMEPADNYHTIIWFENEFIRIIIIMFLFVLHEKFPLFPVYPHEIMG
jgi:hypothetical protein